MKEIFRFFKVFITFIAGIFLFVACKKNDLPKATQTGRGIFAAQVDGIKWEAGNCWSCSNGGMRAIYGVNSFINLTGRMVKDNTNMSIEINIENVTGPGTYELGEVVTSYRTNFGRVYNSNSSTSYYTPTSGGKVIITKLDLRNKIVSGTFDFKASSYDDREIVVSRGRFDLKLED